MQCKKPRNGVALLAPVILAFITPTGTNLLVRHRRHEQMIISFITFVNEKKNPFCEIILAGYRMLQRVATRYDPFGYSPTI